MSTQKSTQNVEYFFEYFFENFFEDFFETFTMIKPTSVLDNVELLLKVRSQELLTLQMLLMFSRVVDVADALCRTLC